MKKSNAKGVIAKIPAYIILIIIALLVVVPLLWLTLSAFKEEKEILSYPPTFWTHSFTLDNFIATNKRIKIFRYILNSIIYSVGTTALAVVVNCMAGYAYARKKFKGKNGFFLMTLATMMVPFQVIMVPLFLIVYKMGMYNNYWGLIIPRVAVAGSIFMMRAAFSGLPKELEDAARIDGLSEYGIFWRIMLPQVKSSVICLIILSINGSWNDLLWPMIVASDTNMRTLANGLALFVGQNSIQYGASFAGALISLLPMLILYIFGQKYFVEGMASSGLKS
ncbi:MAG: carbohydrate ABC transporter permease [Pseudobutyrivibrio ruminis]|uniref:carbohydrate ABC transporter permease n=1 Tax=Pseudobutyrivibrio ruminis TaxID=46206 RepID=UPI0026EA36D8|nr:carbohydrate ABC transporter permease [Pseudobutyrivibrio ruminis]MBE5913715.1 carbohydrate ABC transporter permease [Pseudobutyrivibrio ruminis]MBE6025085.1 carbohydrate ABC transporter permease [Cellulosilyticum sp.]